MLITEATLEMHYHRPLLTLFADTFGKGGTDFQFFKYSPQREKFLGFDQAYAMTEVDDLGFYKLIAEAAKSKSSQSVSTSGAKFVGYFLQFKVVSKLVNRTKNRPPQITSEPFFRAKLDTARKGTDPSQHELLFNLSRRPSCFVYYACPMIFDRTALYVINPGLDDLCLADALTCPANYTDNDQHHIFFQDPKSNPIWRSEPTVGKALVPSMLVDKLTQHARGNSAEVLAKNLLEAVVSAGKLAQAETHQDEAAYFKRGLRLIGANLCILRFPQGW